ncbi:MAG: hypothetical protein AAF709_24625 [Pseudomonadota bacterium]
MEKLKSLEERKEIEFVFLGHPRCGSAALAAGLRQVGLDVEHERLGAQGLVSWWHVGFSEPNAGRGMFRPSNKSMPRLHAGRVFQYLRRPSSAVPSIIVENDHNNRLNNSFRFRQKVILEKFGVDISAMTSAASAITSYVLWNRLAKSLANAAQPILVEKPDFNIISPDLDLQSLPVRNTTAQKFGTSKRSLDLRNELNDVPSGIADEILEIEGMYD